LTRAIFLIVLITHLVLLLYILSIILSNLYIENANSDIEEVLSCT
jgi:hypothetical protein